MFDNILLSDYASNIKKHASIRNCDMNISQNVLFDISDYASYYWEFV